MTELETVIRQAGEDWMVDSFALPAMATALERADQEYNRRFDDGQSVFTPKNLAGAFRRNSRKIRALLQALGATSTPAMLVMVWRILLGASVAQVDMTYVLETSFDLTVRLITPCGVEDEVYKSTNIDDAALLGHLGIMKMDGRPIFDGFYALNVKG